MLYLSPYHQPVLNSVKFRNNVEISQKWANSAAWHKILCAAKKLWSLVITRFIPGTAYCGTVDTSITTLKIWSE